jgi:hypothetical protein
MPCSPWRPATAKPGPESQGPAPMDAATVQQRQDANLLPWDRATGYGLWDKWHAGTGLPDHSAMCRLQHGHVVRTAFEPAQRLEPSDQGSWVAWQWHQDLTMLGMKSATAGLQPRPAALSAGRSLLPQRPYFPPTRAKGVRSHITAGGMPSAVGVKGLRHKRSRPATGH